MNRSVFYHKLKCFVPLFRRVNSKSSNNCRYLPLFSRCRKLSCGKLKIITTSSLAVCKQQYRSVFSSNLAKSDGKSNEQNPEETNKDLLADEEFQNILKDFAKDFGVDNETENILEIKKYLDKPAEKDLKSIREDISNCGINQKYKDFSEADSVVLPSHEEVQSGTFDREHVFHDDHNEHYPFADVSTKHGVAGVYDIEELVNVLCQENLMDITAIAVPKDLHYVDYLVLATAKSPRHSEAVCEIVIKMHKKKKHKVDPFILLEGKKDVNWKALDMGNIVLHIFLCETRKFYDIESLWLFDSEYDSGGTQKPDPTYGAIAEQLAFFNTLQDNTKEDII